MASEALINRFRRACSSWLQQLIGGRDSAERHARLHGQGAAWIAGVG